MCRFGNGINSPQPEITREIPNHIARMAGRVGEVAFQACEDCIVAAGGAILTRVSEMGGLYCAVPF